MLLELSWCNSDYGCFGSQHQPSTDTEQKLTFILNPSALCLEGIACHSSVFLLAVQSQRAITINYIIYQVSWSFRILPAQLWHIPAWLGYPLYYCFPLHLVTLAKNIGICLPGVHIEFLCVIFSFYAAQPLGKLYQSQSQANANVNVRCCRYFLPVFIQVLTQPSPL